MDRTAIPLHQPAAHQRSAVWTERIPVTAKPVRNSVHRHSYHEIFLFKNGDGRHMIDLEIVDLQAPCIHFVAPGQVHQLERSAGSEGAVIMFTNLRWLDVSDPIFRSIIRGTDVTRNIPLTTAELEHAVDLFERIEEEQIAQHNAAARVMEQYLGILLLKCIRWNRNIGSSDHDRKHDLVSDFIEIVDRDFLEKKLVGLYAVDLSISAGHLNDLVKKRTGKSAGEIIHERILLEAKRLLLHSDLSVKEVSFALRMDDPAYFTRMFRKATGMTPVDYREHIREKYQS